MLSFTKKAAAFAGFTSAAYLTANYRDTQRKRMPLLDSPSPSSSSVTVLEIDLSKLVVTETAPPKHRSNLQKIQDLITSQQQTKQEADRKPFKTCTRDLVAIIEKAAYDPRIDSILLTNKSSISLASAIELGDALREFKSVRRVHYDPAFNSSTPASSKPNPKRQSSDWDFLTTSSDDSNPNNNLIFSHASTLNTSSPLPSTILHLTSDVLTLSPLGSIPSPTSISLPRFFAKRLLEKHLGVDTSGFRSIGQYK
jgi:hypothetical protein